MATFADLKRKVSLRLQDENNTAVSAANVGECINEALTFWKKQHYWFNEGTVTVNTIVNNPVLPSSGLLYLLPKKGARVTEGQTTYNIYPVSPNIYNDRNYQGKGPPRFYSYQAGSYNLYYYPDKVYAVTVVGVKDYLPLVNDTDSNDFTINAESLILYEALSRAYQIRDDFAKADAFASGAISEDRALKEQTRKMEATNVAVVDDALTNRYERNYYA